MFPCEENYSNVKLGFAALISRDVVLRDIMPCVKDLVTDGSQHVRAAIATHISGIAPMLGKEK